MNDVCMEQALFKNEKVYQLFGEFLRNISSIFNENGRLVRFVSCSEKSDLARLHLVGLDVSETYDFCKAQKRSEKREVVGIGSTAASQSR